MNRGEQEEIEKVAREIWLERGGVGGSAEEDWYRACEIVRGRNVADRNSSDRAESYQASTGPVHRDAPSKENAQMENTMTGMMEQTSSGRMSHVASEVSSMASGVKDRVNTMMDTEPKAMPRMEHREGCLARTIEQQTAKIPSDAWLWGALGSMGLSLAFELSGREKTAHFLGHWSQTLLIFGLYNKMVKLQGSDGL